MTGPATPGKPAPARWLAGFRIAGRDPRRRSSTPARAASWRRWSPAIESSCELGKKYGVDRLHTYEEYDECLASGGIDAVYIALPNSMHADYTIRAARAGVHVLCEKPLAVTVKECLRMIRESSMQVNQGNIRTRPEMGGGTLHDLGIYCINAARYLFRAEPEEVFALSTMGTDQRFAGVDEMTSALLRFPGGRLASFTSSFGAADTSSYRVVGEKGDLLVEPAYEYAEHLKHRLTIGNKVREKTFELRDQFAPELLYFADCIRENREPEPSGKEGLLDVRVIEALQRSAERGRPIRLSGNGADKERPSLRQEMRKPPVEEKEAERVEPPHAAP
jgi:glucose-fructose oxidoreductase